MQLIDIVLHKDEPCLPNENIAELARLLAYILVQLDRTHVAQLAGLPPRVIPVARVSKSNIDRKPQNCTIKRRQFLMTAVYAFTGYRSQGQIMPYVLVNITSLSTGGLGLLNLYAVAKFQPFNHSALTSFRW